MSDNHDKDIIITSNIKPFSYSDEFQERFENIVRIEMIKVSDKNKASYEATYTWWKNYCANHNIHPHSFDVVHVEDFLDNVNWGFNTRKVRLAHLRKYARILMLCDKNNDFGFAYNFETLKILTPQALGGERNVIKTRALSHKQIYSVFDVWIGKSNKHIRNQAILGIMLLSGLRKFEVVALKWDDVDYDKSRIFIAARKGNKEGYVPILGDLEYLLQDWELCQGMNNAYTYVCSHIFRSGKIADDRQCGTGVIDTIVRETSKISGIKFNPHDTRRTIITNLLDNGVSVDKVQQLAGHARPATTLEYAKGTNATALGRDINSKMKFGDVRGARNHSADGRYWECVSGHGFKAANPTECPKCGSTRLSHQESMFDD